MDKLYLKGLLDTFLLITLAVVKKYGISPQSVHLDASSFRQLPYSLNLLPITTGHLLCRFYRLFGSSVRFNTNT